MRSYQKVVATADIKRLEPVVVFNGLVRPTYQGEPTTVTSIDEIKRGELAIYNHDERILRRK